MFKRLLVLLLLSFALILSACTTDAATESPPEMDTPTSTPMDDSEPVDEPDAPAPPVGEPTVLISEVLTGIEGNNNFEFIELTNTGTEAPFDLKGWSLWYKLDDGQDELLITRWTDHTLVPPQGHYVLGRLGYDIGVMPDAVFETSIVHFKGGLQLRLPDDSVVDSLAWGDGPASFAEGNPAPAMEKGISLERAPGGEAGNFSNSDDNNADFVLNTSPNPQNTGSTLTPDPVAQLRITVSAPETAEPGNTFEYTLSVINETGQDVNDLTVQLPIPLN